MLFRIKDGSTELLVIDTTASGGVEWKSRDTLAGSGILGPEEKIIVKKNVTGSGKTKVDMKLLLENEDTVRENTIKDLRYMKELAERLKTSGTGTGTQDKIITEIAMTLPTRDELQLFFRDKELSDYVNTLFQS